MIIVAISELRREPSDLLLPVFKYLLTQCISNELGTQADPEDMLMLPDTGIDEFLFTGQERISFFFVYIHRSAHNHQQVNIFNIR